MSKATTEAQGSQADENLAKFMSWKEIQSATDVAVTLLVLQAVLLVYVSNQLGASIVSTVERSTVAVTSTDS